MYKMNFDDNERRPSVRKTIVYQPIPYINFSDPSVSNKSNKRRSPVSSRDSPTNKLPRSGKSPVKKYLKIVDELKNEKSNHEYVVEQKRKWREKRKNDEDLKNKLNEKKKQSLLDLKIKSKLLLKNNLKKKSLKTKTIVENSLAPPLILRNDTNIGEVINKAYHRIIDNSKIVTEKYEMACLDSFPINDNLSSPKTLDGNQDIYNSKTLMKESLPCRDVDSMETVPLASANSPSLESAAIKIQSSYRRYKVRKNIEVHNHNSDTHEDNNCLHINKITEDVMVSNKSNPNYKSVNDLNTSFECFPSDMPVEYPYKILAAVKNKFKHLMNLKSELQMSSQLNLSPIEKLSKEFLASSSFYSVYKQNLDSVYIMPKIITSMSFLNSSSDKPIYSEANSSMKELNTNFEKLCEYSAVKEKNKSSIRKLSPDQRQEKNVCQKSSVISELKSSLQEIKNLTVSVSFNEVDEVNSTNSRKLPKKDLKMNEISYKHTGSTSQDVQSLNNIVFEVSDNSITKNTLSAPNINLTRQKKNDTKNSKRIEDKSFLTQFKNELNLLDSFNQSLRQVQAVEETLSTIRHNLTLSISSQLMDAKSELSENERTNNNCYQIDEHLNGVSSFKPSSNTNISQTMICEKENLPTYSSEHNKQKKMLDTPNKSLASSNLQNQIQMQVNSFQEINTSSKNTDIKSGLATNAIETIQCNTRKWSSNKFEIDENCITNIYREFSDNSSLAGNITQQDDFLSFSDISSDATLYSNNLVRGISKCKDLKIASHLSKFCACLISQYIEDEKTRSEHLDTILKVREKTLLDATRLELMYLQMRKKQNQELVPLLKKKQRGLLLKSQQERNEIKYIKKFQLEQSQERKASLKKQLKQLKRMFSCEGSVIDLPKSNSLKNSTLIWQAKTRTPNNPVKGKTLSFSSEASTCQTKYSKLQESLEKKQMELNKQKTKLNELLEMHYGIQLDTSEIKTMEQKLQSSLINANLDTKNIIGESNSCVRWIESSIDSSVAKENSETTKLLQISHATDYCNIPDIVDDEMKNKSNQSNYYLPYSELEQAISEDNQSTCNISISSDAIDPLNAGYNFVLSGDSLNKLWEKITGDTRKKYDSKEDYHMSKKSLDVFFEEAKQYALQDLLKSLEFHAPINTDLVSSPKKSHSTDNDLGNLQKPEDKIITSSLRNFKSEDFSKSFMKSSSIQEFKNAYNIINNLIQPNSFQDLNSKLPSSEQCEPNVSFSEINVEALDNEEKLQGIFLTDTFTVKDNSSIDSNDQSDSSKSTAHSLVDELIHVDITKLNEDCENYENEQYRMDPILENDPNHISTKSFQQYDTNKLSRSLLALNLFTTNNNLSLSKSQEKYNAFMNICTRINLLDDSKPKQIKEVQSWDPCLSALSKTEHVHFRNKEVEPKSASITNIQKKPFDNVLQITGNTPADGFKNDINVNQRGVAALFSPRFENYSDGTVNDPLSILNRKNSSLDINGQTTSVERKHLHSKIPFIELLDVKSPLFHDSLLGHEPVTPSPDQSPRGSPTGEYSPAAVSLSVSRIDEAEELRKKQLAIELEIKALEQQSQIPFCLVREIPDKPPPPYIPPSEETKLIVSTKNSTLNKTPKAIHTVESYCNWLWNKFSTGKTENITYKSFSNCEEISASEMKNNVYLFDICHETFQKEFSEINTKPCRSWEYNKENKFKSFDREDVCLRVEKKVNEVLGFEINSLKENVMTNWSHKRQNYVNDLLVKELYKEEGDWVNTEESEIYVKNDLTNAILDSLISEVCAEIRTLYP